MSLFFPTDAQVAETTKPPATTTLTLERALTNQFVSALQTELGSALTVTDAENFERMTLPACFVRCTRQRESIINSGIFEFSVDISLLVQADDSDPQAHESLWAEVLCIAYDIFGLVIKLNAIRPQYSYVYGIVRDAGVTMATTDRHFERSVSLTVHAALVS